MKKMMSTALVTATISIAIISNINANPTNIRPTSEATILGQQVIRELGENVKKANIVYKAAVNDAERQESLKSAHETALTLVNTLKEIKTFGNDIVRGYNPAQRRQAAITLAELLMRENSLDIEIKSKRMEILDMTNIGYIIDTAIPGKAEARSQAQKEQKEIYTTRKDIQKAIIAQETILGQPWSNTIKLSVHNLIVGNSLGIAYGIDWYFNETTKKQLSSAPASQKRMPNSAEIKKQNNSIKKWRNELSRSDLLSKEIASAHQLSIAKQLLKEMNDIKEDLKNVPKKYKSILNKVSSSIDSLERKIDRAKVSWLKVV